MGSGAPALVIPLISVLVIDDCSASNASTTNVSTKKFQLYEGLRILSIPDQCEWSGHKSFNQLHLYMLTTIETFLEKLWLRFLQRYEYDQLLNATRSFYWQYLMSLMIVKYEMKLLVLEDWFTHFVTIWNHSMKNSIIFL